MKPVIRSLLGLLLAGLLLPGCGALGESPPAPEGEGLLICASFYTMGDFAQRVAGERGQVRVLAPSGAEPHDWEPSPQDIALLEQADLLVVNGAGFEHWVEGVTGSLNNRDLAVVDTSREIPLLTEEGAPDPHIWLDPARAKGQMAAIRDSLTAADPAGADAYEKNFQAAAALCDRLDQRYRQAIQPLPGREIVVAHDAFGYLCDRYGLSQIAVQGLEPEGEPDPARMAEVIRRAGREGVRVIFFEEAASPKVAQAIAREIGAETAVLNPIEGLTERQAADGADYFSLMEDNLGQLVLALE